MTRQAVKFPRWLTWHQDEVVEVEKVQAAPFYATTYAVFRNGEMVGYVASRPEKYHATLWAYAVTERDLRGSGQTSRATAVSALLSHLNEQKTKA